ncbi:hypothetical protein [Haliangium sp.]|uniref:hypothetical protein n=1 Tax=Haliangium sp. TaxID=2663208 RepID=UPI003D1309D1
MSVRPLAPAGLLVLAAIAAGPAQAEPPRWQLAVDGGSEYDTNVHRCEQERPECAVDPTATVRTGARLRARWHPGRGHLLHLRSFGGARLHGERATRDEDRVVAAADGGYRWRVPGRAADVGLRGHYYESFAAPVGAAPDLLAPRNLALAGGELSLAVAGPDEHAVTLLGGYRHFRYKPDRDFDWHGDHYGLRYHTAFWRGLDPAGEAETDTVLASIDLRFDYELERRRHRGSAQHEGCANDELPTAACARRDLVHKVGAELVYTSDRAYSARYQFEVADSNSPGPYTQTRHRFELGLTTEVAARIFLTAELNVQLIRYRDPLLIAGNPGMDPDIDPEDLTAIEDEGRSSLRLHLSRDLGRAWSVEARYAFYTNAVNADSPDFRRQLAYLGVVYRYRSSQ